MSDLEKFVELLRRSHGGIQLIYQRKRYKAKTILNVLYCNETSIPCGRHSLYQCKYVVECEGSICFYVKFREECKCRLATHEVHSCHKDKLPNKLEKIDLEVCEILFPIEDDSDSC